MLAQVFWWLAALLYVLLVYNLWIKPMPRGGDAAMGYGLYVMLVAGAWVVALALLTAALGWQGAMVWTAGTPFLRFAVVVVGFAAVAAGFACALVAYEAWGTSLPTNTLARVVTLLMPLLALVGLGLLAHDGWRARFPADTHRWVLLGVVVIGGAFAASSLLFARRQAPEPIHLEAPNPPDAQ